MRCGIFVFVGGLCTVLCDLLFVKTKHRRVSFEITVKDTPVGGVIRAHVLNLGE